MSSIESSNRLTSIHKPIISIFVTVVVLMICFGSLQLIAWAGWGITFPSSSSMPRTLYLLAPVKEINVGDIVAFYLPKDQMPGFGSEVPSLFLKSVAAGPGDHVCVKRNSLFINGRAFAHRLTSHSDFQGYKVFAISFCRYIRKDEFLPLSLYSPRSFDGRYFGPVKRSSVQFKAFPL